MHLWHSCAFWAEGWGWNRHLFSCCSFSLLILVPLTRALGCRSLAQQLLRHLFCRSLGRPTSETCTWCLWGVCVCTQMYDGVCSAGLWPGLLWGNSAVDSPLKAVGPCHLGKELFLPSVCSKCPSRTTCLWACCHAHRLSWFCADIWRDKHPGGIATSIFSSLFHGELYCMKHVIRSGWGGMLGTGRWSWAFPVLLSRMAVAWKSCSCCLCSAGAITISVPAPSSSCWAEDGIWSWAVTRCQV